MKKTTRFLIPGLVMTLLLPGQLFGQIPPASSWEYLGPEGGYLTAMGQNPSNGDLYAVSYGYPARIFKSTSNGDLWEKISEINDNICFIAINPQSPQNVVASNSYLGYGTYLKVYKSSDGGRTWAQKQIVGQPNCYYYVQHLDIDQSDPKTLTFAGYIYGYAGGSTFINAFECKTTSGGDSWAIESYGNITSGEFYTYCMATDPVDAKTKYVGGYVYSAGYTTGKIFRTSDNGMSWTDITGATVQGFVYDLHVDRLIPGKVLAVTGAGVYRSTDKGSTWQRGNGAAWGNKICCDPKNASVLYVYGSGVTVYRSSDGGANWMSLTGQLGGGSCTAFQINTSAAGTMYATTRSGFYRSVNSGQTWTLSSRGLSSVRVPALKCAPSAPKSMNISFMYSGFYKTSDAHAIPAAGGITWQKMPEYSYCEGIMRMEVSPTNPDIIYIQEGAG